MPLSSASACRLNNLRYNLNDRFAVRFNYIFTSRVWFVQKDAFLAVKHPVPSLYQILHAKVLRITLASLPSSVTSIRDIAFVVAKQDISSVIISEVLPLRPKTIILYSNTLDWTTVSAHLTVVPLHRHKHGKGKKATVRIIRVNYSLRHNQAWISSQYMVLKTL